MKGESINFFFYQNLENKPNRLFIYHSPDDTILTTKHNFQTGI
jgi:hypothetical protein